jgi:phthalate 4,5-dioxygenase oxygenase subunit
MTTATENDTLTQVGPGTPMGELMRQYWIPAAMSSELKADGDPMRLMLLGEKLVAFRDSSGKVGIFDHRCPHRRASLFFGRNEQGGIRCVYHGWKFDTSGQCLETLNVPDPAFKDHIRAKAYRTAERNGIIYAFMGNAAELPPLPEIEPALAPEKDVHIQFELRECNWLQAVEGELDTSHVGIMHFGAVQAKDFAHDQQQKLLVANRAPEYKIAQTDYGYIYGAHRPADEGQLYWRIGQFLMPFWTMPPINHLATNVLLRVYVPVDDHHTMVVAIVHNHAYPPARLKINESIAGASQNYPFLPNTTDWLGRWRLRTSQRNDFEIDREVQRTKSFTGIEGVQLQDQAIQESMGPIADRPGENLAPSDIMIVRVRRLLMQAVTEYREKGTLPPTASRADLYRGHRGGHFIADAKVEWREAYSALLARSPWETVGKEQVAA